MKHILLLAVALLLAACGSVFEMPENNGGNAADEMKLSPCACDPIPFNGGGFRWVG